MPLLQHAQALVEAHAAEVQRWQHGRSTSRGHLARLSLIRHPWRAAEAARQTSQDGACQRHAAVAALAALVDPQGLPRKKHALATVRRQLAGIAALVEAWWQEVWHDVEGQVARTPGWKPWIAALLLPLLYGQEQRSHARCPTRQAQLVGVLQAMTEAFETPPLTQQLAPDVLLGWKTWAAEHARGLQRASSAVAGRNGALSPLHHTQRGLPRRRSKVWTVVHHFDCRASDGTTPAARFFRRAFPDLFETVLSQIDDLPRPRQHHQDLAISA
ncbi:MAG TPA: DUF6399 domain-containing protein [Candidatus Saccharimonadia bacterium]|nr:DUF6399 domain-containing protein [Candidatus Saccharimonadia bacterium]